MLTNRRNEEAALIRNANVACAMGRLLLGELKDWHEFIAPDLVDYASLPRRQLKSGKQDIQKDLANRIEGFCARNFDCMNGKSLVRLYDLVKAKRGIEISYSEFKEKFSSVKNFAKLGYPKHSTVCITLWGMQYRFPERDFTNDLLVSLDQLALANQHLAEFTGLPHAEVILRREDLKERLRSSDSAKRQIMQASFSLIECYLNGIAWNFCQEHDLTKFSKTQADLLRDASSVTIRDKMIKYPKIVFGTAVDEGRFRFILDVSKQYRDSIMHPSPFAAPEKFGGYDKLEKIYTLSDEVVKSTVLGVVDYISGVIELESSGNGPVGTPAWIAELRHKISEVWK